MPKIRIRPGRGKAVFGVIWGAIFVGIGLFVAIPFFGVFGVFWTLMALAITAYSAFLAFSDRGAEDEIHFDDFDQMPGFQRPPAASVGNPEGTETRLRELEGLKTQGLITDEEYSEKRGEILEDL